jgi:hypothetical protein
VRLVPQRFKEEGLKLRLKKGFFCLQEMEYLAYTVSAGEISVSTKKVETVVDWSAYDAEGGSQFRAILQLQRQVHSSC